LKQDDGGVTCARVRKKLNRVQELQGNPPAVRKVHK